MVRVVRMVKVVQMVQVVSLDDMYSENIWFTSSKASNPRKKLRCHVCDEHMDIRTNESRALFC